MGLGDERMRRRNSKMGKSRRVYFSDREICNRRVLLKSIVNATYFFEMPFIHYIL